MVHHMCIHKFVLHKQVVLFTFRLFLMKNIPQHDHTTALIIHTFDTSRVGWGGGQDSQAAIMYI